MSSRRARSRGSIASSALQSVLFEVPPRDPSVFVGAALMLLAVGCVGSYLPARRAVAVNPVDSLRGD